MLSAYPFVISKRVLSSTVRLLQPKNQYTTNTKAVNKQGSKFGFSDPARNPENTFESCLPKVVRKPSFKILISVLKDPEAVSLSIARQTKATTTKPLADHEIIAVFF